MPLGEPDRASNGGVSLTWVNNLLLYIVGAVILGGLGLLVNTLKDHGNALDDIRQKQAEINNQVARRSEINRQLIDDERVREADWERRFGYLANEIADLKDEQDQILSRMAGINSRMKVRPLRPTPTPDDWTIRFKKWMDTQTTKGK